MTSVNTHFTMSPTKLSIIAAVLLLIIMLFTGVVNYMTFADNYNQSLATTYGVAAQEYARSIEYSLRYGKPIDNYYGMNVTLTELNKLVRDAEHVYITLPNGQILYDTSGFVSERYTPAVLQSTSSMQTDVISDGLSFRIDEQKVWLFTAIYDGQNSHIANVCLVFPSSVFVTWDGEIAKKLLNNIMLILAVAIICIAVLLFSDRRFRAATQPTADENARSFRRFLSARKNKLLLIFLLVFGTAQIVHGITNYTAFEKAYQQMAETSGSFVQAIVEGNVERVHSKGLTFSEISGFEEYLIEIEKSLPQIVSITKIDNIVDVKIANQFIVDNMRKIMLDIGTVVIISILFMVEMTLLTILILTRKIQDEVEYAHGMTRGLAFFINFSAFMPLTFLVIVMRNIYQPLFSVPYDVVLGLPLSAEMLGGMLAIVSAYLQLRRSSWRNVFYLGILLLIAGNAMSAYAQEPLMYIAARFVAGFGLGSMLMTTRSLIVSMPRNTGAIAAWAAGAIAGLNCGLVIGGMLADRISYDNIFLLAALMAFLPFMFVKIFMSKYEIDKREQVVENKLSFIKDRALLLFLVCILVPFFIAGAFLDYFFPLFASGLNLNQSDISRGFLLNGLMVIYLGPFLTKWTTEKISIKTGMLFSMILVIFAIGLFAYFGNVAMAFVAVALLGVAESFGLALKTSYFMSTRSIGSMSISQGVAGFSFLVNTSRMAGPLVIGALLSLGMVIGMGLLATMLLFLVTIYWLWGTANENKNVNT